MTAGRLSRAAVFAGATLAGACWTSSSPQQTTPIEEKQGPVEAKPSAVAPGEIRGVVRNGASGAALAGFRVLLRSNETGASQQGLTDQNGEYVFSGLPAGSYVVSYQPNHPRQGPTEVSVTLAADAGQRADIAVYFPEPDRGPCCKPYGAPPARRRIV